MAIDFVHSQQIVEAMRDVLIGSGTTHAGGLPVSWFRGEYQFTGTGVNDAVFTDAKSGTTGAFTVEIVAAGTPDTFRWKKGSGSWSATTNITGSAQTLSDGLTVTFGATTGHVAADSWVYDTGDTPLVWLEHGDYEDYVTGQNLDELCPSVFVKSLGMGQVGAGIGGCIETAERVRVIHIRRADQCYTTDGVTLEKNLDIARQRYAKTLSDALFNDPKRRLAVISGAGARTEVSLTCADTAGAQLFDHRWVSTDLRGDVAETRAAMRMSRSGNLWAIAIDSEALVRSG